MKPQALELPFCYHIRASTRATRLRINVSLDHVEVVAPAQIPHHKIHQFISAHQHWVVTALAKIADKQQSIHALPAPPSAYQNGVAIRYLGVAYPLLIQPTALKKLRIELSDTVIAYVPTTLASADHSAAIKTALTHWLKQQAKLQVEQLVKHHSIQHQLVPKTLNIRTQKSRWGSCGIHNDIQINWLLIMAPIDVLEYVVVHELCHIREKNHSRQFWALVAAHLPNYQTPQRWLKQHGSYLMRGL